MAVTGPEATGLSTPNLHGYLLRRSVSEKWVRYWCVIQGGCLYCYLTPDDHVCVDITDLDGYSVTELEDKFPDQPFVLHLEHDDYISVYLSATCRKEMEEWKTSLISAVKDSLQENGLESRDHTDGEAVGQSKEDRGLVIKQKLLAEMLRQTQELEKKQSTRQAATKSPQLTPEVTDTNAAQPTLVTPIPTQAPIPTPASSVPTGEQICKRTRLRQRRMSAQIKLDTLQKQIIQTNNGNARKSRFSFIKKKSSTNLHNSNGNNGNGGSNGNGHTSNSSDIVQQLKVLSEHLTALDRDLDLNSGKVITPTQDAKVSPSERKSSCSAASSSRCWLPNAESLVLNRSNSSRSRRSSNGGDKIPSGENGVARSNSLKSSMQKLAHKTFAKAGWYRTKKSSVGEAPPAPSPDKDETSGRLRTTSMSGDLASSLTHHRPDVVDLSQRLRRVCSAKEFVPRLDEEEGSEDTFLPPPSPFRGGDTPSPVSSPHSTGSVSSEGGRRHSSSGSLRLYDDPRSPRRRTDPDAIAIIEAFEEMSRQILGEAPT